MAFLFSMVIGFAFNDSVFPLRIQSLDYPAIALQAGVKVMVTLECSITSDGTVESVRVVSGPPVLAEASIANLSQWTFSSTEQGGRALRTIQVVYDFQIEGSAKGPTGTKFVFEYPNKVIVSTARPMLMISSR